MLLLIKPKLNPNMHFSFVAVNRLLWETHSGKKGCEGVASALVNREFQWCIREMNQEKSLF